MNPRLVVGWLPAYGAHGPYAGLSPDEGLIQAVAGVSDAQWRYGDRPVFLTIPIAGYAQGIIGAAAVVAALYARARSGTGRAFELSGVAALLAMETFAFLQGSGVLRLAGRADPRSPLPTYRLVRASDDWLFVGALTPAFWASLAVAAGLDDCLVDPRFDGAPLAIADLDARRELAERLHAAFRPRTRAEWLQVLEEADVPRGAVCSREEYARDPQVRHNEMLISVEDPELGPTEQMNVPVWLHSSPGQVRGGAPRLGEHQPLPADLSRAASVVTPPPVANVIEPRAPLDGLVVLDLSGYVAGANGPMLLADMGASVIKVEGPDGDGWRTSGLAFLGANRGKRGLCLDLKRPEGRATFLDLVERADVVVDNYRAGVLERLGLDWETLHRRNPRLIHCSVTGFGPSGPDAGLPGFDPILQSRSGLMRAQGEPGGEPVYLQIAVCDYGTALMAAYGVLLALIARDRDGEGQRVETCLVNNAFSVQAGEFIFYDGGPADPPGGRDLAGRHALYRIYGAADGWLFLACTTPEQAERLTEATGGPFAIAGDLLTQPLDGEMADELARRLVGSSIQHWLARLTEAGVPCAPCTRVEDTFTSPQLVANGIWQEIEHPQWGAVRQVGVTVNWDGRPAQPGCRAPLLGEHSIEVLHDFGLDDARIRSLLDLGVVVQASGAG